MNYPENTIENMLNDVIGGLSELEKYQVKQLGIRPKETIEKTIRLLRTKWQAFLKRNPNFLTIVAVIVAVLTLAAMLFFNLPLLRHK